jgi:hypothetical protein
MSRITVEEMLAQARVGLERLDPARAAHAVEEGAVCDGGYASSFAAATLQELGFSRATDLDGGFQAWRAAGLPVQPGSHGASSHRDPGRRRGSRG